MDYRIAGDAAVAAKAAAQTVDVAYRSFLLCNNGANVVYFREAQDDGKPASAARGMALRPGETMPVVLNCKELSLCAPAGDTDVRILYLDT